MSGFSETMHLKEQAEEDIYFARRDRELILRLHEEELARKQASEASAQQHPETERAVDRG